MTKKKNSKLLSFAEDDDELASALCFLFAVMGENTLPHIYSDQELGYDDLWASGETSLAYSSYFSPAFVRVMTDCTSHHNPDITETILQCWDELAGCIEELDDPTGPPSPPLHLSLTKTHF